MTDTLESLQAEWEQCRNYDPYALIARLFAALKVAEQKLDTYREWHLKNPRQVNVLREALLIAQRYMPRLNGRMHDHDLLEETKP